MKIVAKTFEDSDGRRWEFGPDGLKWSALHNDGDTQFDIRGVPLHFMEDARGHRVALFSDRIVTFEYIGPPCIFHIRRFTPDLAGDLDMAAE